MERDRAESERLFQSYRALVPAMARRWFPRRHWDEDLLQCGFMGLWEAACRWNGQGKFGPYAGRCVRNNMKDYFRAEKKTEAVPVPAPRRPAAPDAGEDLEDGMDLVCRIQKAWPKNSRERFVLLAFSRGITKRRVAAALGVEMHTLRRIALRGFRRLAETKETAGREMPGEQRSDC